MKKIIKTLLILSIFLGLGQLAFSQEISADEFRVIVVKQAKADLLKYDIDDTEIKVGHLPINSFSLPDGKISVEIVSGMNNLTAREFKKINIFVNGSYVKTYYAPIETRAFKYVAVAKEIISRDKVVPLQAVEFKRMDIVGNINNTVSPEDISKELVATKVFYPGEVITKRYTMAKPDVVKNSMVTVNFKTNSNINISIEGTALTQGNIGDIIQVKNKRFNKIYTGEITGINQVLVQI